MRNAFFVLSTVFACLAAMGQGRVTWGNDSNHLIQFSTKTDMLMSASGEDARALAGLAVSQIGSTNPVNLSLFTA